MNDGEKLIAIENTKKPFARRILCVPSTRARFAGILSG
jgi:hypothetical protein